MLISYKNGQASVILRVKLYDSSVSTGAGKTGLTGSSAGLIISTIADNEASPTVYTQAASHIQTIAALGTYAAPSASNCRFSEVDSTNHPGVYEIQIADARFAVSNAKSLLVSIGGVTNLAQCDFIVPLTVLDPYTAPLTAAAIATGVWTDTTAGDFTTSASIGKSVLNGVALGTGLTINAYTGNTVQTGDAYARLGAPAGASVSADVAAIKSDTGTILTDVNSGAGAIYSRLGAPAGASMSADIAALKTDLDAGVNTTSISGSTSAATNLKRSATAICLGTVGSASTTTSIVTSALDPAAAVTDQYKGRIVIFDRATTTTNLRGQATNITGNTSGGVLTVTALSDAPVSGDTFTIT